MRQRDRESVTDSDTHDLLFGPSDDDSFFDGHDSDERDGHNGHNGHDDGHPVRVTRVSRRETREAHARHSRRRRNGRLISIMAILLVAVVGVATWLIVLPIYHYFNPNDYSGAGTGTVVIEIKANDGAGDIGRTLHDKGVVASVRAFTNVADDNSDSQNIQPGSYNLRSHMSAQKALNLLLDPSSRVRSDLLVFEGATSLDVEQRLVAKPCTGTSKAVCGPGMAQAEVVKALKNIKALGLPTDYKVNGKAPTSVEGFLFPATYAFPSNASPSDALQQMITKFTDQARTTNFTAQAKALHITPYQELVIASMVQSEAKYPADGPKVARVILNRLAAHTPLKVDAATRYGALIRGVDPNKIHYDTYLTPYNTYLNAGLPPTPISNPGADAMKAAAHPAAGKLLYYVNGDKQGHLFFTSSETAFVKAQRKCHDQGWGCAAP